MVSIKIFFLALVLISMALMGLAIGILVKKNGKFPNFHIGRNRHMRERGIRCAKSYDRTEQAKARKKITIKSIDLS